MIEQKLKTYFKQFTAIVPRGEFLAQSRATVTAGNQLPARFSWVLRIKETFTTGGALALASLLLLIVLGGVSYGAKQSGQVAASTSLNNDSLAREATSLTFQVKLKDAQYFDESASQVVRALDQLSGGSQQLP